jgi:polysaccharide pyruvyl transferase WcaK-like protein
MTVDHVSHEIAIGQPGLSGSEAARKGRVAILNAYSGQNVGDRAIVEVMAEQIGARGFEPLIVADEPRSFDRLGVAVVPPPLDIQQKAGRFGRAACELREALGQHARPGEFFERHGVGEFVAAAGGGYLYDDGSVTSRRNLLRRLHYLSLATRSGRQVAVFPQSVGPFSSRAFQQATMRQLRRCSRVFTRERMSHELCRRHRLGNALLRDDVVFLLGSGRDAAPVAEFARREDRRYVGVTAVEWGFGSYRGRAHLRAAYLEALTRAARDAHHATGCHIAVIVQVDVTGGPDSDRRISEQLAEAVAGAGIPVTMTSFPATASLESIVATYRQLDLLIASRMHSGILAFCAGVPVVGVAYLPKTYGVFDRLGMGDYTVDIRPPDVARLPGLVGVALAELETLAHRLDDALGRVRASALASFDEVFGPRSF